jgi:hypothetical protein
MIFDGLVPGSSEGDSTAGAHKLQGEKAEHGTVDADDTAKFTVKFVRGGWV